MSELFKGTNHAKVYAKYRPTTPQIVVDAILAYLRDKLDGPYQRALDVGCGSGQSTRILSKYFQKVTGVDVSESQIEQAKLNPENQDNVEFAVSTAETLMFEDNSMQLVTASTAFHYFDQERFLESAKRILDTNGVLAIYSCEALILKGNNREESDALKKIVLQFHVDDLQKYRPGPSFAQVKYEGVKLPLRDCVRAEDIVHEIQMLFPDYIEYLTTWSAYQKLLSVEGHEIGKKLLDRVEMDILTVLNVDKAQSRNLIITIPLRYVLLMGRK